MCCEAGGGRCRGSFATVARSEKVLGITHKGILKTVSFYLLIQCVLQVGVSIIVCVAEKWGVKTLFELPLVNCILYVLIPFNYVVGVFKGERMGRVLSNCRLLKKVGA